MERSHVKLPFIRFGQRMALLTSSRFSEMVHLIGMQVFVLHLIITSCFCKYSQIIKHLLGRINDQRAAIKFKNNEETQKPSHYGKCLAMSTVCIHFKLLTVSKLNSCEYFSCFLISFDNFRLFRLITITVCLKVEVFE